MQAAGGAVDPFWSLYKQHLTKDVLEILEGYRIGTLKDYTPVEHHVEINQYANEPKDRLKDLPVYSEFPFNAGTLTELIPDNYVTPTPLSYVRHHHPVPKHSDDKDFVLKLGWGVELSLEDLKTKFPQHEIVATMICAGNRRDEFNVVGPPVQGLKWKSDAVSTGKWKGVMLKDLKYLIQQDVTKEEHVWFSGKDDPYDASIPVSKAFGEHGDVLIAYELNDMAIPREHGGPLRVIVPGYVAARSVKWLERIGAANEESLSPWQRGGAYKSFGPQHKTMEKVDFSKFPSVQEMPVQSSICKIEPNEDDSTATIKGWAWSGGGRKIIRVEVSPDGGQNWIDAELGQGKDQPSGRAWAWTFFSATCKAPIKGESTEYVVRAVDESFNVQPETPKATWNLRGILNNSYHRVRFPVPVEATAQAVTAAPAVTAPA